MNTDRRRRLERVYWSCVARRRGEDASMVRLYDGGDSPLGLSEEDDQRRQMLRILLDSIERDERMQAGLEGANDNA